MPQQIFGYDEDSLMQLNKKPIWQSYKLSQRNLDISMIHRYKLSWQPTIDHFTRV